MVPARQIDCKVLNNSYLTTSTATAVRRACARGALAILAVTMIVSSAAAAGGQKRYAKLDGELNERAASALSAQTTSVIVRVKGGQLPAEFKKYARPGRLDLIDGYVLDVPNSELKAIASNPNTLYASHNGTVHAFNFRTGVQSGAFFARRIMGFNGAGVGIAVLDSGIALNDEFDQWRGLGRAPGASRVYFQDFLVPDAAHALTDVRCTTPCDTNGHGTHVAGTIAGNGFNSFGEKSGMAPDASLIALRVLGADGTGSVDGVLSALTWVFDHAKEKNIRVVNLSFGMKPSGSLALPGAPVDPDPVRTLLLDPLAAATKKLVDAGIFVVGAAGNIGQVDCATLPGHVAEPGKCDVWGGITAPGTFPWVFTVGANSSQGTLTRGDDVRPTFSSRGPAFPLQIAKPDILAGGVGIESTAAPLSTLYQQDANLHPEFLLPGAFPTTTFPYTVLSGTSQAAAAVSGVAAQMLQANPNLTPNLIKAILEYTSEKHQGYSPLEQGAGFLNALGAVRLSRFYATAHRGQRVPVESIWSKHFIWGNHEMSGGLMLPKANAWNLGVLWGTPKLAGADGDNIVWGTSCGSSDCGDNIVWGTAADGDNIVWGTADGDNIVWGTSADGDNIVWGTAADGDNIVWGTDCSASGQDCGGNIVWGTAADGDNIVWGTAADGDNIVWGTVDGDNIVWGTAVTGVLPSTQMEWYQLFLNRRFDAWWVAHEFGDSFISNGGHRTPRVMRLRKLPTSQRHQ